MLFYLFTCVGKGRGREEDKEKGREGAAGLRFQSRSDEEGRGRK